MKLFDIEQIDSNNLIVVSRVLDKRGTKQTSLLLDATNNKFWLVDDDDNYYLVNPNIEGTLNIILSAINSINQSIDNCPPCITNTLSSILDIVSTIPNEGIKEVILASINESMTLILESNQSLSSQLSLIEEKVKNERIIIQEKRVEVIKEKIVEKPILVTNYIEVRTTKYIQVKEKKPDKVEVFPPTPIPPSSIPGWIYDSVKGYYYKIKRGIKYIRINNKVWREVDWLRERNTDRTVRERVNHFNFGN